MTIYVILLFLLFFLAFRYVKGLRSNDLNPWMMSLAFSLKVGVGFCFLYIYTFIYGNGELSADAGVFMRESKIVHDVFYSSPLDYLKLLTGLGDQEMLTQQYLMETDHWDAGAQAIISDNRNIMRVHSLMHFLSFGNVQVHMLLMCVLSLIGIKQLFAALRPRTSLSPTLLFAALLLFPSLLFWSSGILKEPLLFLGSGIFIRGVLDKQVKYRWGYLALGLLLMLAFKPYVLLCLLPAIAFYILYKAVPKHKFIVSLSTLSIVTIITLLSFPQKRQEIVHLISRKQFDFKNVGRGGLHAEGDTCFYFFEPEQIPELLITGDSVSVQHTMNAMIIQHGSIDNPTPITLHPDGRKWYIYFRNHQSNGYIEMTMINDSFWQLILNIPEALFNTLLRPLPFDPGGGLKYPAMLEVIILFAFLTIAVIRRKKLHKEQYAFIFSILIFVFNISLIIGWVTPVLGAIARYRTPAYIALLIIGLIIIDRKKVQHG